MKRIIHIFSCLILLLLLVVLPVTTAHNTIEIQSGQIESGFMIGIMHVHHKKTGWGWTEIWQPISIFRYSQRRWTFHGPFTTSFTPYDLKGVFGPLYHFHSYCMRSGFFFISAKVLI